MKPYIVCSVIGAALFAAGAGVHASGSFNGTWEGTGEAIGDCREIRMAITVADGRLTGWLSGSRGTATLTGSVSADGSATIRYGGASQFEGSLKFSGATFEGRIQSYCGEPKVNGSRKS